MVREIKDKAEFDAALKAAGDKLVVVDFTASWCGPCKVIGPVFKELSEKEEYANIVFLKVDVDDAEDVAAACGIEAMPTFFFFKQGNKIDHFSGADGAKLKQKLNSLK